MIKYKRFLQKLDENLKYIFSAENITNDTKVILLVLAATMTRLKFYRFLDGITQLDPLNAVLKEINYTKIKKGQLVRDYIIVYATKKLTKDVDSDELQQLISASSSTPEVKELAPALHLPDITIQPDKEELDQATQKATAYLIKSLDLQPNQTNALVDTYLHCRDRAKPVVAYYALVHAMANILESSGLEQKNSLLYSYKLAGHALKDFIHTPKAEANKPILHIYSSQPNLSS